MSEELPAFTPDVREETGAVRIAASNHHGWSTRIWVNGTPIDGLVTGIEYILNLNGDNEVVVHLAPRSLEVELARSRIRYVRDKEPV